MMADDFVALPLVRHAKTQPHGGPASPAAKLKSKLMNPGGVDLFGNISPVPSPKRESRTKRVDYAKDRRDWRLRASHPLHEMPQSQPRSKSAMDQYPDIEGVAELQELYSYSSMSPQQLREKLAVSVAKDKAKKKKMQNKKKEREERALSPTERSPSPNRREFSPPQRENWRRESPTNIQSFMDVRADIDVFPHRAGKVKPEKLRAHSGADERRMCKPKFLEELELYVVTELEMLGCPPKGPSESRMQVHREVFESIIEKFTTYRPILNAIKNEYELLIEHYSEQSSKLAPLESSLHTLKHQTEHMFKTITAEDSSKLVFMKNELHMKEEDIKTLNKKVENEVKKINSLQEQLDIANIRESDAHEQNKTLLDVLRRKDFEIDELRLKYEAEENNMKARLSLGWASPEDWADLKNEFRALQQKHVELQQSVDKKNQEFDRMRDAQETLDAEYESLAKTLEEAKKYLVVPVHELQDIIHGEQSGTDWSSTTHHFVKVLNALDEELDELSPEEVQAIMESDTPLPGQELWKTALETRNDRSEEAVANALQSHGLSGVVTGSVTALSRVANKYKAYKEKSQELELKLDSLMVTEAPVEKKKKAPKISDYESKKFFVGRGTGKSVPKFLRFKGRARNRNMSKRDTEAMIKEIWAGKRDPKHQEMSLEEYVYIHFQKKFGIQNIIAEWGYNLLDAAERYQEDADCEMFLLILKGEMDEDVYLDQGKLIDKIIKECHALDAATEGKVSHKLIKKDFIDTLRHCLPTKTTERFNELVETLCEEQKGDFVKYEKLFEEDREYNQGPFCEALRDQFVEERAELTKQLEDNLWALDTKNEGVLSGGACAKAFQNVDPGFDMKFVMHTIHDCLKMETECLPNTEIDVAALCSALHTKSIQRKTKKREDPPA